MNEEVEVLKYTLVVLVRDGCFPCTILKKSWDKIFLKLRSEFSEEILTIRMVEMKDNTMLNIGNTIWPSFFLAHSKDIDLESKNQVLNKNNIHVYGSKSFRERTPPKQFHSPDNLITWVTSVMTGKNPELQEQRTVFKAMK